MNIREDDPGLADRLQAVRVHEAEHFILADRVLEADNPGMSGWFVSRYIARGLTPDRSDSDKIAMERALRAWNIVLGIKSAVRLSFLSKKVAGHSKPA